MHALRFLIQPASGADKYLTLKESGKLGIWVERVTPKPKVSYTTLRTVKSQLKSYSLPSCMKARATTWILSNSFCRQALRLRHHKARQMGVIGWCAPKLFTAPTMEWNGSLSTFNASVSIDFGGARIGRNGNPTKALFDRSNLYSIPESRKKLLRGTEAIEAVKRVSPSSSTRKHQR